MKKILKKAFLLMICVLVAGMTSTSVIQAAGGLIRPYTFGFGSSTDKDEGTSELIKEGDLQNLSFTDSKGHTITYWAHVPKDKDGKPIENLPMVVYMHGYSDGGAKTNTNIRMHNGVLYRLIKEQEDSNRKAIIIAPQTPIDQGSTAAGHWMDDQWVGIQGADKWSQWNRSEWNMAETPRTDNLNSVVELVKNLQKNTKSDTDRAYVTGISMGGYATWDLISRDDEHLFAAAVPICGVGDVSKIKNAKDTPIRTYHGGVDSTINASSTRKMYKALRKYGNITYTEYADENHLSWQSAYSNVLDDNKNGVSNIDDMINWMFNQSRKGTLDGSVDKEPLRFIIKDAKAVSKDQYANEDYKAIEDKVKEAEVLLKDDQASNADVKACIRKLDVLLAKTVSFVDVEIPLSSIATGSQYPDSGNKLANAFDGNVNTIWHSNWNEDYATNDKHWITFELPKNTMVNALRYLPRQEGGSVNGIITKYEIYAGDTLDKMTKIAEGNWASDKEWKVARFQDTTSKYIKFKSVDAMSEIAGRKFASAAEIRLARSAKAEAKTYTVTFKGKNGQVLKTDTVNEGEDAIAPTAPTIAGYRFKGWDKDFTAVNEDLSVQAIYEEIPVSKDALQEQIELGEQVKSNSSAYRKDTYWNTMLTSLTQAKLTYENAFATQKQVDDETRALAKAIKGIRLLPQEAIITYLNEFIARVSVIDRTYYKVSDLSYIDNVRAEVERLLSDLNTFEESDFEVLKTEIAKVDNIIQNDSVKYELINELQGVMINGIFNNNTTMDVQVLTKTAITDFVTNMSKQNQDTKTYFELNNVEKLYQINLSEDVKDQKMTIRFKIDDAWKNKVLNVVAINKDGAVEKQEVTVKDGYIVFETTQHAYYAITSAKATPTKPNVETSDSTAVQQSVTLMGLAASSLLITRKFRKKALK